jgi:heparan-alpha-glucosaminide N-acetyltransferase
MNELVKKERILAIDIFRGITILTMVFVNDLASVKAIPAWMKHHAGESGMTFVDLVFPAFLFIVGMSLPFAIDARRKKGDTTAQLLQHIFKRTVSLIFIGVMMVNMGRYNPQFLGISKGIWEFAFYLSVIFFWMETERLSQNFWKYFKYTGGLILLLMFIFYRGGDDLSWLKTSWWGILGLIGWAYLTVALIWLIGGANGWFLSSIFFILILLYGADENGLLPKNELLWIGGHLGSHSALTLAGLITGLLFHRSRNDLRPKDRLMWLAGLAALFFAAGYLLHQPWGVNKNLATPAWTLYSAGWSVIIFAGLYIILDLKGWQRWALWLQPAGMNPLLAYLLPGILYALGSSWYFSSWNSGLWGIFRSILFTILILEITRRLTRQKIRLHL